MALRHQILGFRTERKIRRVRLQEGEEQAQDLPERFLRVSKNGRYLAHADSTPFFWLGDTAWNGALLSSKSDWEIYLNDRAKKGSA